MHNIDQKIDLDLRGTVCPMAFVKLRLLADQTPAGALVHVLYENSKANEPLARSTAGVGHKVVSDEPWAENEIKSAVGLKLMTIRVKGSAALK